MVYMNVSSVVRVNISLPESVVVRVKKRTQRRGMSKFLSEAAEEKLAREEREEALRELKEAPPTFTEVSDSRAYIRQLRASDEERLKRFDL